MSRRMVRKHLPDPSPALRGRGQQRLLQPPAPLRPRQPLRVTTVPLRRRIPDAGRRHLPRRGRVCALPVPPALPHLPPRVRQPARLLPLHLPQRLPLPGRTELLPRCGRMCRQPAQLQPWTDLRQRLWGLPVRPARVPQDLPQHHLRQDLALAVRAQPVRHGERGLPEGGARNLLPLPVAALQPQRAQGPLQDVGHTLRGRQPPLRHPGRQRAGPAGGPALGPAHRGAGADPPGAGPGHAGGRAGDERVLPQDPPRKAPLPRHPLRLPVRVLSTCPEASAGGTWPGPRLKGQPWKMWIH
nr:PREDICTED: translation initiation factor IF-2 isoform X1 [Anolis carolinensis]|eukprot:XP_016854064.1 PREDICTED: translation initiation factor IF-2 isoform X1 [Anolis carolinensis]